MSLSRPVLNKVLVFLTLFPLLISCAPEADETPWHAGIVWYQIFPERFENGDPSNDPTIDRIENQPEGWKITPWTSDWYKRSEWEENFRPEFNWGVTRRRYGGDLQGIINRLDYLDSLGIGGIYLNPVFDAESMHKYDASMYHHIDRFFGPDPRGDVEIFENEDPSDPATWQWSGADSLFLLLIKEAHKRDIRIVIDGVFNHTGTDFWAFKDLEEHQQKSSFKEWYHVTSFDDPETPENEFDYEGWWGFKSLPEFREEEGNLVQPVRDHIFAISRRWMDPNGDGDPSDGVDGWRLDVAGEVGFPFWEEWHSYIRSINPDIYTTAEEWDEKAVEFVEADRFNGVMNYRFTRAADDFLITGKKTQTEFTQRMMELLGQFGEASHSVQNLMDSHDTERVASRVMNRDRSFKEDSHADQGFNPRKPDEIARKIQKQVAVLQFTWPGAPMIYYGTEAGMWGADDPDDRKPMVWPDYDYDAEIYLPDGKTHEPDSVDFDTELFSFYRKLIDLKNTESALRFGSVQILDEEGVFAFSRGQDGEISVFLNASDEAIPISLEILAELILVDGDSEVSFPEFDLAPRGWLIVKQGG